MIDVINLTPAIAQGDQQLDGVENVLVGQRHGTHHLFAAQTTIKFHAADCRKIVGVFVKEEPIKEHLHRIFSGRLTGAHHAIDRHSGRDLIRGLIHAQRGRHIGTMIQIVGVEGLEFADLCATHLGKQLVRDLFVGLTDNLTGLGIDHGMGKDPAQQVIIRNADPL